MRKKVLILIVLAVLSVLMLAACSAADAPEELPAATPEIVETPAPTPTPTPEPELPAGMAVTVDGKPLESGSVVKDGTVYVKLDEFTAALGSESVTDGESASFVWRRRDVGMDTGSAALSYGEKEAELAAAPAVYRGEIWIPVESACEALEISTLYDEEYDRLYCTPGAGSWELKPGYRVPICMYHAVCESLFEYMLYDMCLRPSEMEEQLSFLTENGYDTIFFDDLEHIEDYDKPVILTFDDGYDCLYDNLFPLLKKYNAKAVVYLITGNIDTGAYHSLSREQIVEMAESGLVSFQSHTVTHPPLIELSKEAQAKEYYDSKLFITRLVGKEPFSIAYPEGKAYPGSTTANAMEYYRFGVRMGTFPWYTDDDPSFMYRLNIKRDMPLFIYQNVIDMVDPDR